MQAEGCTVTVEEPAKADSQPQPSKPSPREPSLARVPDARGGRPVDVKTTEAIRGRVVRKAERVFWARVVPLAYAKARVGDWDAARFLMAVLKNPKFAKDRAGEGAVGKSKAKAIEKGE